MTALTARQLGDLARAITTQQARTQGRARIAREYGTCLHCSNGIRPGDKIVKEPGRAWAHGDCTRPGRRTQRRRSNTTTPLQETLERSFESHP
jgi:hypothetical protein